jgi:N-methylhydantoinase A
MHYKIGIDIGGTFNDFVIFDQKHKKLIVSKTSTTPNNYWNGINLGLEGLNLPLSKSEIIAHGTTIGLNTLLQRTGSKVGLITTQGFRDAYEIGRGARPDAYNLFYKAPKPLVPRQYRLEVSERINVQGKVIHPLNKKNVEEALTYFSKNNISNIAICFLHSYLNPKHEIEAEKIIKKFNPNIKVSLSSNLIREFREYERTSTTCINSYIQETIKNYIDEFILGFKKKGYKKNFFINQSAGGLLSAKSAKLKPVTSLMSGPSGGVVSTSFFGKIEKFSNLIAFDMGGTSTDVCVILENTPKLTADSVLEGYPVMVPTLDVHSIGAGGGSIASIDDVGSLIVGPKSAGASPGPACYGHGGKVATVTDANCVLNRVSPSEFMPSGLKLNKNLALKAINNNIAKPLKIDHLKASSGILEICNLKMANAVRSITIERGLDPSNFTLCAYGGAGPMHACWIAKQLGIPRVMIPVAPGQFSALGILLSQVRHDLVRTVSSSASYKKIGSIFLQMNREAKKLIKDEKVNIKKMSFDYSVDARYKGQEFTINVSLKNTKFTKKNINYFLKKFNQIYEKTYSYSSSSEKVEIINLRLVAIGHLNQLRIPKIKKGNKKPLDFAKIYKTSVYFENKYVKCDVWKREKLLSGNEIKGPAMIVDYGSTTIIPNQCLCKVSEYGQLIIKIAN